MIPLYTKFEFDQAKTLDLLSLQCEQCSTRFEVTKHQVQCALRENHSYQGNFCSLVCSNLNKITAIETVCAFCNLKFSKRASQFKKTSHHFCSRSCAAKLNNKLYPKKTRSRKRRECEDCNQKVTGYKSKKCRGCYSLSKVLNSCIRTIDSFSSTYARHKYQNIRNHAHSMDNLIYKLDRKCKKCSYDKHTELCHIKQIKDWPKTTKLREVNSKDNLVYLCPTHHWELDNGYLTI